MTILLKPANLAFWWKCIGKVLRSMGLPRLVSSLHRPMALCPSSPKCYSALPSIFHGLFSQNTPSATRHITIAPRKYSRFSLESYLFSPIAELKICQTPQSSYWLENLEGSIFAWLFGRLVVCLSSHFWHSDVTLALEDAQVVRRSVGQYWLLL